MSGSRALVLAAHGSRRDSSANAIVWRHVETIRDLGLFGEVTAAFHQGTPGFDTVLGNIRSRIITVVPFMTSAGYYADDVLPAALQKHGRFGELDLRITPALGTHPGLAPLVARRVSARLREHGLSREKTTLALVGHGTSRHPESRTATIALARALQQRHCAGEVLAAFIDDNPPLDMLASRSATSRLIVVPFLIGGSVHALRDIPEALPPGALMEGAIGEYDELTEIITDLAQRYRPHAARYAARPRRSLPGTVHLVGAGPGDPGLITVRGMNTLRRAQVVVHDRLVAPALLGEARADAEIINVGKAPGRAPWSQERINELLIERARLGLEVVRLKGGDPFVFGRGAEEVAACRAARVPVSVVPGVSSAIAGPAAAGIPVTARGLAASFTVVTAHRVGDAALAPGTLTALAAVDTIVVLMGRAKLATFARGLMVAGRDPATPAACIQDATTAQQRVTVATLATIAKAAERDGVDSPMITVVGAVAALATERADYSALVVPAAEVATASLPGR